MVNRNNKKTQTGKVIYCFAEVPGLLEAIWHEISDYDNQKWELPKKRELLEEVIGEKETDKLYAINDTIEQNVHLRTLLTEPLKNKDNAKRIKAMDWIVVDWGGIRRGSKAHNDWVLLLQDYDDAAVTKFIETRKNTRVSSWSKILAFADSTKYAIFDSRVSISLNTIFDKIGYNPRFHMPQPQSDELKNLFMDVKGFVGERSNGKRPVYLDYFDYLTLLKLLVVKYPSSNILDLEMCLFANSKRLAIEYAKKHNIPYKIPKK